MLNRFKKQKYYYVSYSVKASEGNIYGAATFKAKGKPKIKEWLEEIEKYNRTLSISVIIILSCIEVDEDFL